MLQQVAEWEACSLLLFIRSLAQPRYGLVLFPVSHLNPGAGVTRDLVQLGARLGSGWIVLFPRTHAPFLRWRLLSKLNAHQDSVLNLKFIN